MLHIYNVHVCAMCYVLCAVCTDQQVGVMWGVEGCSHVLCAIHTCTYVCRTVPAQINKLVVEMETLYRVSEEQLKKAIQEKAEPDVDLAQPAALVKDAKKLPELRVSTGYTTCTCIYTCIYIYIYIIPQLT